MTRDVALNGCFDKLSIGVALIDERHTILDYNHVFETLVRRVEPFNNNPAKNLINFVGSDLYQTLGNPRFETECYAPCRFAEKDRRTTRTLLSWGGSDDASSPKKPDAYYELSVAYVDASGAEPARFLVELRDVTEIAMKARKSRRLEELSRELILAVANSRMKKLEEKKELLKTHIRAALHDVFNYDVFEIRIVDQSTEKRELKLFVGWHTDDEDGSVLIRPGWNENGITGCVAISREPYICDDTRNDAHYKKGRFDARSSMTVPLIVRDMLIGVCNVESEEPNAFTEEDSEFLTSFSRAVALALYFINFLSSEFNNLLYDCGREIDDRLRVATSSLLERTLELSYFFSRQKQNEFDYDERKDFVDSLVDESLELSASIADLKRSLCRSERKIDPDFDVEAVYRFLETSRILVVGSSPWNYVRPLEELGACVDVVSTTGAALSALKRCAYDLVVSERTPDGKFFENVKKTATTAEGRNSYGLNVYDIHKEGYFTPIEGDPDDAKERQRIKKELEQGKRDAYHLYKEMIALEKNRRTLFVLAMDYDYDCTHILNALSAELGITQPAFPCDTKTTTPVLKAIRKLIDYRSAREAKGERRS